MNNIDFSNLELSIYQKFVLRTLPILKSEIFYRKSTINDLRNYGLIKRGNKLMFKKFTYVKTDYGKMYFRIKRKDFIRFAIPTVISVIALLAAYDVLWIKPIAEGLQVLASLLKNIMESLGVSPTTLF